MGTFSSGRRLRRSIENCSRFWEKEPVNLGRRQPLQPGRVRANGGAGQHVRGGDQACQASGELCQQPDSGSVRDPLCRDRRGSPYIRRARGGVVRHHGGEALRALAGTQGARFLQVRCVSGPARADGKDLRGSHAIRRVRHGQSRYRHQGQETALPGQEGREPPRPLACVDLALDWRGPGLPRRRPGASTHRVAARSRAGPG
jgi:hypothetical protein